MGALFDSAYEGIQRLIEVNPVLIQWKRYPLMDNGRGMLIPDTQAEPEEKTAWVRISHQAGGVQDTSVAATGHTTNLSQYLVMLPEVDIRDGEIITTDTGSIRTWKVGVVDELIIEGECYGKQAPLTRADG
jgi:CO/xanthine dehydrogenase Mo-binding subunit